MESIVTDLQPKSAGLPYTRLVVVPDPHDELEDPGPLGGAPNLARERVERQAVRQLALDHLPVIERDTTLGT